MKNKDLDLDKLKRVADAATKGAWVCTSSGSNEIRAHGDLRLSIGPYISSELPRADAEHIATFDPPTVKRLIAMAKFEAIYKETMMYLDIESLNRDRVQLRARVAELTEELEGVNASAEDEEVAHRETLDALNFWIDRCAKLDTSGEFAFKARALDNATEAASESDQPQTQCPGCGAWVDDFDGFGVLGHTKPAYKDGCGYCSHPTRDLEPHGWVCGICGDVETRSEFLFTYTSGK